MPSVPPSRRPRGEGAGGGWRGSSRPWPWSVGWSWADWPGRGWWGGGRRPRWPGRRGGAAARGGGAGGGARRGGAAGRAARRGGTVGPVEQLGGAGTLLFTDPRGRAHAQAADGRDHRVLGQLGELASRPGAPRPAPGGARPPP